MAKARLGEKVPPPSYCGEPRRQPRGEPRGPVGPAPLPCPSRAAGGTPPPQAARSGGSRVPRLNVCVCVFLPPLRPCREGGDGARGEDGERQTKESAQTPDYLFQLSAGGVAEEISEDPVPRPARAGRAGCLPGAHADTGTALGSAWLGPALPCPARRDTEPQVLRWRFGKAGSGPTERPGGRRGAGHSQPRSASLPGEH